MNPDTDSSATHVSWCPGSRFPRAEAVSPRESPMRKLQRRIFAFIVGTGQIAPESGLEDVYGSVTFWCWPDLFFYQEKKKKKELCQSILFQHIPENTQKEALNAAAESAKGLAE